nr:hypothetical protein DM860_015094 [Ipomoea batatas]
MLTVWWYTPRNIPRQIPSFVGWTSQLIKDREVAEIEAGGFGLGRDEENIQAQVEECYRFVPQVYVAYYVEKLHLLGITIVEVIELASKPPPVVRDNEVIKLIHTTAQKLLGVTFVKRAGAAGDEGDGIGVGLFEGGASLEIEIFSDSVGER